MNWNGLLQKSKAVKARVKRYVSETALSKTYQLVSLQEYCAGSNVVPRQLQPFSVAEGPKPLFLRDDALCDLSEYDGSAPSPEVSLYSLNNVEAVGRTEFILAGDRAMYPDVIEPRHDAFMMELENRGSVDLERGTVKIFPRKAVLQHDRAISLLGQCNGNYAHWITEVLTRFVLIDQMPEYQGWPLLVDHPVHEKLVDALDFLNICRREIINVLPYQRVSVGQLIYISPPSMTPPETRQFFETGSLAPPRANQFHFSGTALSMLRIRAVKMAKDLRVLPMVDEPWCEAELPEVERIYLPRRAHTTGNGRLLENGDDVEHALGCLGYTSVNIADYSFEGQVLSVQSAAIVVAPIGAALANLVFRRPGSVVIILTPQYRDATFYYFSNLMAALGHRVIFVLGLQTPRGDGNPYNRNFRVSLSLVRQATVIANEMFQNAKTNRPCRSVIMDEAQ